LGVGYWKHTCAILLSTEDVVLNISVACGPLKSEAYLKYSIDKGKRRICYVEYVKIERV